METLSDWIVVGLFFLLVAAPAVFWRMWENYKKGQDVFEDTAPLDVHYPVGRVVAVVNDEEVLAEDERHLALVRWAQVNAKSDWAKWHWRVVELRLLKEMKWKATAALTNGSTFRNGQREYALYGTRTLRNLV
jgi:hypothetical protein